jgi:delta 1-pyrroline-5-carboxylate dehydrogenase
MAQNLRKYRHMGFSGSSLIGGADVHGEPASFQAINPATGKELKPMFGEARATYIAKACALAAATFDAYRETSLEIRAVFLETIAAEILSLGDELLQRAAQETGLAIARIETERARTVAQLRLFAATVRPGARRFFPVIWRRAGAWHGAGVKPRHQGSRLHRLPQWRPRADENRRCPGRANSGSCRDEQH